MKTVYQIIQEYKAKDLEKINYNAEIDVDFQRHIDLAKIEELSNLGLTVLITILSGILTDRLKK